MLKALKSYWAFTSCRYKLIMLVVVPILFFVTNITVYRYDVGTGLESFWILYVIDTISDDYFMGGFYKKGNHSLGFLQSSSRFRKMMQEVVIVDVIRRVIIYQIPYVTLLWCSIGDIEAMEWCRWTSFVPWIQVLTGQIVVLVRRHGVAGGQNSVSFAIGYIYMLLAISTIGYIGEMAGGNFVPVIVVTILLILFMAVVTMRYTDKKMEESYYD